MCRITGILKNFVLSPGWKNPQDIAFRFLILNLGLFLFAYGSIMVVKANIGFVSWDVFHWGLSLHTPLTFGQSSQVTGLVIIGIGFFLGIKPGLATIMNMLMIGFWADQLLNWNWVPAVTSWGLWAQVLLLIGGALVIGMGSGLYIKAGMGSGPRDGFMLGLSRKTGWRVAVCRTIIEISVCLVGWLLGGPMGLGTLFIAFALGPSVELGFWTFRVEDPRKKPLPKVSGSLPV
jgi:uncharacterized membrane protein YczE